MLINFQESERNILFFDILNLNDIFFFIQIDIFFSYNLDFFMRYF